MLQGNDGCRALRGRDVALYSICIRTKSSVPSRVAYARFFRSLLPHLCATCVASAVRTPGDDTASRGPALRAPPITAGRIRTGRDAFLPAADKFRKFRKCSRLPTKSAGRRGSGRVSTQPQDKLAPTLLLTPKAPTLATALLSTIAIYSASLERASLSDTSPAPPASASLLDPLLPHIASSSCPKATNMPSVQETLASVAGSVSNGVKAAASAAAAAAPADVKDGVTYDIRWMERDYRGYLDSPPNPKWPNGAKVAVNFVRKSHSKPCPDVVRLRTIQVP